MGLTKARIRLTILRRRAREFANMVKQNNMAFFTPDELIDWCTDAELAELRRMLEGFGLVLRADHRWEEKR